MGEALGLPPGAPLCGDAAFWAGVDCDSACAAEVRSSETPCASGGGALACVRRIDLGASPDAPLPLSALSALTGLESLNITGRPVSGSLGALRGVGSLISLRLDAGGLQGSLAGLRGLTSLEVLDLSALPPGDPRREGGTAWEKSSPGILGDRQYRMAPDVGGSGGGTALKASLSGGLEPLASLLRLRFVRIEGTRVGGDLSPLRNLTELRELHLGSGSEAAWSPSKTSQACAL